MPFNSSGFADVDYQSHYRQFASPFIIETNEQNNDFFRKEAQQNHIYGVNNALDELIADAALLAFLKLKPEAESHMRFGVLRRLRMISTAFRKFQSIIPPNRTVPLTQSQSDDVARYLNSIYIDVLGLMDNYAWVLTYQLGNAASQAADKMKIGLFKSTLAKDRSLSPLITKLQTFANWEKEVKERRNPAAHRMPLYVPPTALTPDDLREHEKLGDLASAALRNQEFECYRELHDAQQRIGSFIPKFLHDPKGQVDDIYPTIPSDIGNAILIGREVQTLLRQELEKSVA
ncbi:MULTISPECIES: hypothetical protein [Rhizobium]|uniref:hypothetical protein n=1 Tax=Rhizobium TaxID=379 RepID=UPI002360B1EE|nr:hypothetical protein [Rhizobium sp. MC62]MDC9813456.1 hypothetical protein [Rhizobium sp. MC62]